MISLVPPRFRLDGRAAVITGGGGLMGREHAAAIAEAGGIPILWEINTVAATAVAATIQADWGVSCHVLAVDITDPQSISAGLTESINLAKRIDILINNAANDPKVNANSDKPWSRLENFPLEVWNNDIAVGLTGAFLCARAIGAHMAESGGGVILNIASDLGLIAPDQRIYRQDGLPDDSQPAKPVTYSIVKHGLIGLTRYLATYWADRGVRSNALCPGGIFNGQPDDFVAKLTQLIPMGRMAHRDEYRGTIQYLCSDASSYVTGSVLSADGGRTAW